MLMKVSDVYQSNKHGTLIITNYINWSKVGFEFVNTGYKGFATANNIRLGDVKDLLSPSILGVGFIGDGIYKSKDGKKITGAYQTWKGILRRCYCSKFHKRNPRYKGCSVSDDWHNYQTFAKWFYENHKDGLHLDKDIKVKGNRVYSPKTCLFVSQRANSIEAHAKRFKFKSPLGFAIDVYNLSEFCRVNGLSQSCMSMVHSGKSSHHKKWTKI